MTNPAPQFCMRPGWVISTQDQQRHYISAGILIRLYQVPEGRYHRFHIIRCAGDRCQGVPLRPRHDGNYTLPTS